MRLGMIALLICLYLGIFLLFYFGRKREKKWQWISALVMFGLAVVATILIVVFYS